MNEIPNIFEHVAAICSVLGIEPENARKLEITPKLVKAEVYLLRNGSKYIERETDEAATTTAEFEVVT